MTLIFKQIRPLLFKTITIFLINIQVVTAQVKEIDEYIANAPFKMKLLFLPLIMKMFRQEKKQKR
jgi:hypothetical protein